MATSDSFLKQLRAAFLRTTPAWGGGSKPLAPGSTFSQQVAAAFLKSTPAYSSYRPLAKANLELHSEYKRQANMVLNPIYREAVSLEPQLPLVAEQLRVLRTYVTELIEAQVRLVSYYNKGRGGPPFKIDPYHLKPPFFVNSPEVVTWIRTVSLQRANIRSTARSLWFAASAELGKPHTSVVVAERLRSFGKTVQKLQHARWLSDTTNLFAGMHFIALRATSLDLSGINLSGARFVNCTINKGDFRNSRLVNSVFEDTHLVLCRFANASLQGTQFRNVKMSEFQSSAGAGSGRFPNYPQRVPFVDLRRSTFLECTFLGGSFIGTDFRESRFVHSTLASTNFDATLLDGASFTAMEVVGPCTFRSASFRNANLSELSVEAGNLDGVRWNRNTLWPENVVDEIVQHSRLAPDGTTYEYSRGGEPDRSLENVLS